MTVQTKPIRIHVCERHGVAERPDVDGADHLTAALATHLQRIACEGARAAWCQAPISKDWWESETGQTGWRAQISPDTLHLIHVVESMGMLEFDDA